MRDVQGQQNSFDNASVWITISDEIWAPPQADGDSSPSPIAKPKPPVEAPAQNPSGPNDKVAVPAQPAPKDAATPPKEKPQPKPPVDYPIPAPGGKPLGIDELIVGKKNERGEVASKDHSLGADDWNEREAAEKALIGLGVKALPYIDRILFGKLSGPNDKLTAAEQDARENPEVRDERLARIRKRICTDLPRLVRDLASGDEAVSNRAELILRRMEVKDLVHWMSVYRDALSDEQFAQLGKMVHPHVSANALANDYRVKGDWASSNLSSDQLARSLVVHEILGLPLEPVKARLSYSLITNGGAPDLAKGIKLLDQLDGPVDSETAMCRDTCRAVIAMRSGKVEDGLKALEQITDSVEGHEDANQKNQRFFDGPPLAKVCEDLNRLVAAGKIELNDNQRQRLEALSKRTLEFRRSGIGDLIKNLGK